jgi:quercetin dioxygenase-like cupin family protein
MRNAPFVGVCLVVLAGLFGIVDKAFAQRTVMVYEEPRHRVVVTKGDFRLLDVQIIPGDTTLDHTHDSPILYTYISLGNGSAGGRVTANTQYSAEEPFTHRVSNSGPDLFRIIALANYGAGKQGNDDLPEGFTTEPGVENQWFRSYRLELAPGQTTETLRHRNNAVIVQVTPGRVEVSKENGFGAELLREGDWTWRDPGSPYTIRNAGSSPVSVVVNEPR